MSSREFLELVEGLGAESWFKVSLNAALRRAKAEQRRAQMRESAADFEARLRGEVRSPYDMTTSLVDKACTSGSEVR